MNGHSGWRTMPSEEGGVKHKRARPISVSGR